MSYVNRRFASRTYPRKAPVEEGKTYEPDVTDLSHRGDSIARIEGFIVFISNAEPGDQVKLSNKGC